MKKIAVLLLIVSLGIMGMVAQTQKQMIGKQMKTPFSEKKYRSDTDFFRATGNAESVKEASAMDKARINARAQIANNLQSAVKQVTERYIQENELGADMDYASTFESLTRTATNSVLRGVREVDSKVFYKKIGKGKDTRYLYNSYVVLELDINAVKKIVEDKAMNNEKLRVKFDRSKFEKVFDEEIENLAKESQGL